MDSHRVSVRLVSDVPVSRVLLATLNRFHFFCVFLDTGSDVDTSHVLVYSSKPSSDGVWMCRKNGDKKLRDEENVDGSAFRCMSKDYFVELACHFDHYLCADKRIPNRHAPEAKQIFPSTDVIADEFEAELIQLLCLEVTRAKRGFGVIMTHDVDVVHSAVMPNIRSGLAFLMNAIRSIGDPSSFKFFFHAAVRFMLGRVNYNGFGHILEVAGKYEFKPEFFFYVCAKKGSWLNRMARWRGLNPSYDLRRGGMRGVIEDLNRRGCGIGLHGSYYSDRVYELIEAEKTVLERFVGRECVAVRQHFLNFSGKVTHDAYHRAGVKYESNCGFVKANGYYCGTVRPFYARLSGEDRGDLIVVPMVFMDAVPLCFDPKDAEGVLREIMNILNNVRKYRGVVSLNFHQRIISSFPEYKAIYEKTAAYVLSEGGRLASFEDIDSIYTGC